MQKKRGSKSARRVQNAIKCKRGSLVSSKSCETKLNVLASKHIFCVVFKKKDLGRTMFSSSIDEGNNRSILRLLNSFQFISAPSIGRVYLIVWTSLLRAYSTDFVVKLHGSYLPLTCRLSTMNHRSAISRTG